MLIHLVTLRPTGNKPPVVSAYDFLLMACYICKHNVIISLWILCLIRDRVSSVFQLYLSQSQQQYAELCCLNQFKLYSWDFRGVSLSSEVSEGPHVFFLTTKMEMRSGFNFLPCIVMTNSWELWANTHCVPRSILYISTLCICKCRKGFHIQTNNIFISRQTIFSVIKLHNTNFPPCSLHCMNSLMRYLQPPTLIH